MWHNLNRGWVEAFSRRSGWGPVLIVVALGFGCGSCHRGQAIKLAVGEADLLQSGALSMDENDVQMVWQGDDLEISYQVQSAQTGIMTLDAAAWIVDHKQGGRSDPVTGYVQVVDGQGTGTLVFSGLGSRIDDRDMAAYVLRLAISNLTAGQLLAHRALPHRKPDQSLDVFAQDSFEKDGTGVVRVVAHQAGSPDPLAGVPVAVRLSQWDRSWTAAQGKTDTRGELTLEFPVDATNLSDIDMQVVTTLAEKETVSPVVRLKPTQNARIVLTTDKPIYQPEQAIHMRVLALEGPDLLPMAQTDGVFEVFDSKERKVAKFAVHTDAYGIASATMKLGRVIDLGSYRVHAEVGVISTDRTIKVSRYALPRFRVSVATDRPYYLPAQTVTGAIQAEYFFGQKVAQAQVLLKAYTYEAGFTQFAELTLFTDDQGEASFSLPLPNTFFGTEFLQGNASLLIQATVTDAAGHAETASRSLVVAPSDVLIFVVPEAGHVVPGVDNRFFVETVDPTGAPLPCNVGITAPGVDAVQADNVRQTLEQVFMTSLATRHIDYTGILKETLRAEENRLVPEYVEDYFVRAFRRLGGSIERRDGLWTIPSVPFELRRRNDDYHFKTQYGSLFREYRRVTFDKRYARIHPEAEFVAPGHPLLEAVNETLLSCFDGQCDAHAFFGDPTGQRHGALWFVEGEVSDGRGEPAGKRVFCLYQPLDGPILAVNPAILWDLEPLAGHDAPDELVDMLGRRDAIDDYIITEVLFPFQAEIQARRDHETHIKEKYGLRSLDYQIQESNQKILDYQLRLDSGDQVELPLLNEQRNLEHLQQRRLDLEEEIRLERNLTVSEPRILGAAIVAPLPLTPAEAPDVGDAAFGEPGPIYEVGGEAEPPAGPGMRRDDAIEAVGMAVAAQFERDQGWEPEDVSGENHGFDIRSLRYEEDGSLADIRYIEVKARACTGAIRLSANEWKKARHFDDKYWLYIVTQAGTDSPELHRIHDPADHFREGEDIHATGFIIAEETWKEKVR